MFSLDLAQWNRQCETTSATFTRRIRYISTVGLCHATRERESQAGTGNSAGLRFVETREGLKNCFQFPRWDARPAVHYVYIAPARFLAYADQNLFPSIFFRVGDEVHHDLGQRIAIANQRKFFCVA